MRFSRFEDHERARVAGCGVGSTRAGHASLDDVDQRPLANLVVAHLLALRQVEHDGTSLRGREEDSGTRSGSLVRCCQVPMLHAGHDLRANRRSSRAGGGRTACRLYASVARDPKQGNRGPTGTAVAARAAGMVVATTYAPVGASIRRRGALKRPAVGSVRARGQVGVPPADRAGVGERPSGRTRVPPLAGSRGPDVVPVEDVLAESGFPSCRGRRQRGVGEPLAAAGTRRQRRRPSGSAHRRATSRSRSARRSQRCG